jgi:hypothetical protein
VRSSLCLTRPLIRQDELLRWLADQGVRKIIPTGQLHLTLATVREEVDWAGLETRDDELVVPAGQKTIQIFAYTIKAITFGHPAIRERHEKLKLLFPTMDHPVLRPHVSLFKGGRMPADPFPGELVFGPERAEPFDLSRAHGIPHVRIEDAIAGRTPAPVERQGWKRSDGDRRGR